MAIYREQNTLLGSQTDSQYTHRFLGESFTQEICAGCQEDCGANDTEARTWRSCTETEYGKNYHTNPGSDCKAKIQCSGRCKIVPTKK